MKENTQTIVNFPQKLLNNKKGALNVSVILKIQL